MTRSDEGKLERADIQGLVVRGYAGLDAAQFWLLEITDGDAARRFIADLAVTPATRPAGGGKHPVAVQIAVSWPGIVKLEVPVANEAFPREFTEGMDDSVRAVSLGDEGTHAPAEWTWGHTDKPHVLLMMYARDATALELLLATYRDAISQGFRILRRGETEIGVKETVTLRDQREHFGWRDGISSPVVEGFGQNLRTSTTTLRVENSWTGLFPAGEFVLGYKNEYDAYTESPSVARTADPTDILAPTRDGKAKDLGANGTYLVYREMTQNVAALWAYLAKHSNERGSDRVARAIRLGAKMVGRWPSGAPLVETDDDDPALKDHNGFTYGGPDYAGLRCPVGAHIRRANPRDQLARDRGQTESIEMVRKHQMIRRGRSFGAPLDETVDPRKLLERGDDGVKRGLHFICLVGHIGRQFEMVQRAWLTSPNFQALYNDADPIVGVRRSHGPNPNDQFTCPAEPVRRKYTGLPEFTRLVGGGYFFLPSLRALKFIARGPQR